MPKRSIAAIILIFSLTGCGPNDYEKARIADCENLAFGWDEVLFSDSKFTKISDTLGTVIVEWTIEDEQGFYWSYGVECSVDGFDVSIERKFGDFDL